MRSIAKDRGFALRRRGEKTASIRFAAVPSAWRADTDSDIVEVHGDMLDRCRMFHEVLDGAAGCGEASSSPTPSIRRRNVEETDHGRSFGRREKRFAPCRPWSFGPGAVTMPEAAP